MAHHIPKITYGSLDTEVTFTYPPAEDGPEELEPKDRVSVSIAGIRQVSVDYIEAIRKVKFSHLTEAQRSALQTFFLSHAYLGKSFKYFDDKDSADYVEYELTSKFSPRRIAIAGENAYFYELPMTFRRVINATGAGCMISEIDNGVASAEDVAGLLFDSSELITAKIFFQIHRKTDSNEILANGFLTVFYTVAGGWEITEQGTYEEVADNAHGVTFSITAGGQVQYVSDSLAGANYEGTIEYRDIRVC